MNLKQMRQISIIWGVVLVLIVVFLTAVGFLYKHKAKDYKKLEEELVNYAEKYGEVKFLYPEEKQTIKITLDDLKDIGYLTELKKDDDVCDGYINLTYDGFVYQYKGFVKCPKYTTKGYEQ